MDRLKARRGPEKTEISDDELTVQWTLKLIISLAWLVHLGTITSSMRGKFREHSKGSDNVQVQKQLQIEMQVQV